VSDFAKTLERMRRPRKRRRLFRVPRPIISFRSLSWCSCGSTPQYSPRPCSRAAHSSRHYRYDQRRGLVSSGFAPPTFLTSRLISQLVRSVPANKAAGYIAAARSRDSFPISHWAFGWIQPRLRRGSLRLHPSLGSCRLRQHCSCALRRRLNKTRCRARKRSQWQSLIAAT